MNRKVKYTKAVIKKSFLLLLSKKELNKISVKEICELADINRGTFYTHYENVNDLVQKLEKDITKLSMQLIDFNDIGGNIQKIYHDVFTNIKENKESYALVIYNPDSIRAIDNLLDMVYKIHASVSFQDNQVDPKLYEYAFEFLLYGSKQVISKWLASGCEETPEEMSKLMSSLLTNL